MRLLSGDEIEHLYRKHVHIHDTAEYSRRYSRLPINENNREWRWEGKDVARVIAVLEFARICSLHQLTAKHLLTFNGEGDPELEHLRYERHSNFNYTDGPVDYDLQTLRIPRHAYDFVMLNQTLEHVYHPLLCLENVRDFLAPGAYIYANVPTVNIPHSTPFHYYTGFTPTGLACLLRACEFEVIEVGQWGNAEYIGRMFKTQSWPDFRQLRSYAGDFNNPVIAWVLARKD